MKNFMLYKQPLIWLLVLFVLTAHTRAGEVKYPNSRSAQGYTLTEEAANHVRIMHSVNSFHFNAVDVKGEAMTVINMEGVMLPNDEGAPNLPGEGRYIAIPAGSSAKLNIISMQVETYHNIDMAPSPRIPFENDDSPLHYEKNMDIYGTNAFYPADPVKLSEATQIRGVDVVMLGITPFQYNPVTMELKVLRDIEVEVVFEGGSGQFGDTRYRSRWWDPILSNAILNYNSLPEVDYNWMLQDADMGGDACEYLIITPDDSDYVSWADSIAVFRNKQGILTEVYTLTEVGGNTTSAIESFVDNAYTTWSIPPAAVLLLGDFGTDINVNVMSPIYDNYCASDNIYADVDGDHMPEMAFARITANNVSQLETMVTKFLDYETNPPTNPDFYDNPITAIGWQSTRWFQICGEVVGGYWKNELGMNPVRINDIYSGTPGATWSSATNTSTVVDYFGPSGLGYIPSSPTTLGGWTGGSATMINNTINNGSFIMLHRDHGSITGWGEPSYNSSSINSLTNTDLTFVMSINCLTGKYNHSGECFAEKFHRHTYNGENSGALGITAASEVSYSFVNDTYVWGFIDNMWPEFMPDYGTTYPQNFAMPAFGNAAGKFFLQQSSWPYNTSNKQVTYNLFHHHGGAFLTIYYEEPMDLTISHDGLIEYGSSAFEMTADAGSLISLYHNGAILATATATGSLQAIPIPAIPLGTNVTLTVTMQNYYRYEEMLAVVDPLTAMFEANLTTVCINDAVDFTDLTLGSPISWLWTFEGGTPSTSTEQNPTGIIYTTAGDFDVTLEVTSTDATDIFNMTDYISAMDNIIASATINASLEEICEGDEVTFTLETTNGGSSPVYQWKLNGTDVGDGTTVYVSNTLNDEDVVECELTSSYSCASQNPLMSNAIVMSVNGVEPVGVTISCATNAICDGQQVSFDAIPENGGDDPNYQWMINGENCGTNDPYYITSQLENGDIVSCKMFSSALCVEGDSALSNNINMTVIIEPEQLSIPSGPVYVDLQSTQSSIYTTSEDTTLTSYSWTVDPASAWDDMIVNMNTLEVIWSDTYMGLVNINVSGTNDCGESPVSENLEVTIDNTTNLSENDFSIAISIYPNPNSGVFKVMLSSGSHESVKFSIRNTIGEIVFAEEQLTVNGDFVKTIDLSNFAKGVYFLVLENNNKVLTEKIIVRN